MANSDLLAQALDPRTRATLFASCMAEPTPEATLAVAEVLEEHWRLTRDPAHALDASDLFLVAGGFDRAAQIVGELVAGEPYPSNAHRLRLAGARIAAHVGEDFSSFLFDLGTRILPPPSDDAELVRAGAFLRLSVLADATVIDPATWGELSGSPEALMEKLATLFGPMVMNNVILGTLLSTLVTGDSPPSTAESIIAKRMLIVRAIGEDVPAPPSDARDVASWALFVLRSTGVSLGHDGFRAIVHKMIVTPLDDVIRALDEIVSEMPQHAYARSLRANVMLQKVLGEIQRGEATDIGQTLGVILNDTQTVLDLEPTDVTAWMILGWFAADVDQDAARAVAIYDHVTTISPWDPVALRYRGVNRLRAGDEGGQEDIALAEKLLPDGIGR